MSPIATQAHELLARMGVAKSLYTEGTLTARSPVVRSARWRRRLGGWKPESSW